MAKTGRLGAISVEVSGDLAPLRQDIRTAKREVEQGVKEISAKARVHVSAPTDLGRLTPSARAQGSGMAQDAIRRATERNQAMMARVAARQDLIHRGFDPRLIGFSREEQRAVAGSVPDRMPSPFAGGSVAPRAPGMLSRMAPYLAAGAIGLAAGAATASVRDVATIQGIRARQAFNVQEFGIEAGGLRSAGLSTAATGMRLRASETDSRLNEVNATSGPLAGLNRFVRELTGMTAHMERFSSQLKAGAAAVEQSIGATRALGVAMSTFTANGDAANPLNTMAVRHAAALSDFNTRRAKALAESGNNLEVVKAFAAEGQAMKMGQQREMDFSQSIRNTEVRALMMGSQAEGLRTSRLQAGLNGTGRGMFIAERAMARLQMQAEMEGELAGKDAQQQRFIRMRHEKKLGNFDLETALLNRDRVESAPMAAVMSGREAAGAFYEKSHIMANDTTRILQEILTIISNAKVGS